MLLLKQHQDGVMKRLVVIGIPSFTRCALLALFVKWETCSGVEWTIKRMKSLKVDLFRLKEGLVPLTWVRKNRSGNWSGVLGSLSRWAMLSEKNFAKCVQAFMAYTFYIFPKITPSQKEKFLSAINPSFPDGLDSSFLKEFSKSVSIAIGKQRIDSDPQPLVVYQGSPDKKAPSMFGRPSVKQDSSIVTDLAIFNTTEGHFLYCKYKKLIEPLLLGFSERKSYLNRLSETFARFPHSSPGPVFGGEIHFIQEPGGKLRSIASPLRIHQEALRPLGHKLYEILRNVPWDCSFDQSKALPFIQSHLLRGKRVHSVDLSSATDHFPLRIQMEMLYSILPEDQWIHADLFQEISRGIWKSPLGFLKWTKGQPLGLFPSFASFSLCHGLLLFHLNGCRHDNMFFVVGDDVVIMDEQLHNSYIAMLDRMSCPWSADKSISSDKLAEFAGKVVTSTLVIPQLKWREMSNDNFLDICRLLGRKSRSLLSSRQKVVFDRVANLCEPIGLNFSLPGDNLEKMVERTLQFYRPDEKILGSLMGLRRRIHKNIMVSSSDSFDADALHRLSSTFDEKVKSVLIQTLFSRWDSSVTLGLTGLESLPQALGLFPRLPYLVTQPSRVSTLVRYERMP